MSVAADEAQSDERVRSAIHEGVDLVAVGQTYEPTSAIALDWVTVWRRYGSLYIDRISEMVVASSVDLEHELLFCILGGHGVSFELARSAATKLRELEVFASAWDSDALQARVRAELQLAQFWPQRIDGSLRRYRFPVRKSQLIATAASWVNRNRPLDDRLRFIPSEEGRRQFMCDCPGIGLKSASWLLRNTGLATSLAVIDIHVLRALRAAGRIADVRLPRDYVEIEKQFLNWCAELAAPPAAMDLLLWEWQRAM